MKKYVITCDDNYDILHEYVGGGAYRAIAFGTHNELARYIKDNNIMQLVDNETGEIICKAY